PGRGRRRVAGVLQGPAGRHAGEAAERVDNPLNSQGKSGVGTGVSSREWWGLAGAVSAARCCAGWGLSIVYSPEFDLIYVILACVNPLRFAITEGHDGQLHNPEILGRVEAVFYPPWVRLLCPRPGRNGLLRRQADGPVGHQGVQRRAVPPAL